MSTLQTSTHQVLVQFQNGPVYFMPKTHAEIVVKAYTFGSITRTEAGEMLDSITVSGQLDGCLACKLISKETTLSGRLCYVPNPALSQPVIHEFYHSRSYCYSERQAVSRGFKQYAMSFDDTGDIFLVSGRFVRAFELAKETGRKISKFYDTVADGTRDASLWRAARTLHAAGYIDQFGCVSREQTYHLVEVLSTKREKNQTTHLTLVKAA